MFDGRIIVVGGGAAGFFAAIACADAAPGAHVIILERGGRFLEKVRISGGGRCNVTHAPGDLREFAAHYPRGGKALLTPLQAFSSADTVSWFEGRGVRLKTEPDGRMFPCTDSSQTIVDCLLRAAHAAGVELRLASEVESVTKPADGGFELRLAGGERIAGGRLLLATGGCRSAAAGRLATLLGHGLEPPVPSLFTFQVESPWVRSLAGVSVADVEVSVPGTNLSQRGVLLLTHWGVSGPVVLRLSAWGARTFHDRAYRFPLLVNWLPRTHAEEVATELKTRRISHGGKRIVSTPFPPLPARLWGQLVGAAGIGSELLWASLGRAQLHALTQQLTRMRLEVSGKSLNKDEFVTCGGVRLREVDLETMQSRLCPGLFFAGELLDIDGLTGGFNFQAAWTTGHLAGTAMAQSLEGSTVSIAPSHPRTGAARR